MEKTCNGCGAVEKKTPETIPYIVYEAELDRAERRHKEETSRTEKHAKRWMIAFFVSLAVCFVSNFIWIIYESQFETVSYEQDGDGLNNVNIGEQGDIEYGSESEDKT